ncbi:uncharacterized protein BDV17DRAFT_260550 [Aspergillus undulatus]|uniref:uncharacterized protein n=1 Tax=Aspergillus undulatus TaxID=1810928 RepID=UPI003CCD2F10
MSHLKHLNKRSGLLDHSVETHGSRLRALDATPSEESRRRERESEGQSLDARQPCSRCHARLKLYEAWLVIVTCCCWVTCPR